MKKVKRIHRSLMPLLIAAPVWVWGYTLTKQKNNEAHACLELSGKVVRTAEITSRISRVQLIEENKVVDSLQVPVGETFVFSLEQNKYYSIRIYQEGCVPRLVSISTYRDIEHRETKLYKFHFDLIQMSAPEAADDLNDLLDFPVAIITFDKAKGYFDYNAAYTNRMKDLYKKIQSSTSNNLTCKL